MRRMVGPEGQYKSHDINALDCQTISSAPVETQQLFEEVSNLDPPPDPETRNPAVPASTNGAKLETKLGCADDSDDGGEDQDFNWSRDALIHKQPALAIYWNQRDHVVLRQEVGWPDDDVWITIDPIHLSTVIDRLESMRREFLS